MTVTLRQQLCHHALPGKFPAAGMRGLMRELKIDLQRGELLRLNYSSKQSTSCKLITGSDGEIQEGAPE